MKALKYSLVAIVSLVMLISAVIGVLVLLAPGFDGPISRIAGGPFSQQSEHQSIDPIKLVELSNLELEVQLVTRPSVTVAVLVSENQIYVPATLRPDEKRWPKAILRDPRVRIRVTGQVFDFNAHRVADESLHQKLSKLGAEKYSPGYFMPENTWFFHLVER